MRKNIIRQCIKCGVIYGEKEPYEDKDITSGYCPECFEEEMEKLERRIESKERRNPMSTILEQLRKSGIKPNEIDHHESDLYVLKTPISTEVIKSYKFRSSVTTFVSRIDGKVWYDIPFAFDEFWKDKQKRNPIEPQKEYEERELREFFAQLKEIEKASLRDRQEGYQTLVEAIRSKDGVQYLIDDVYGWMLNGSFGFGAYHWFWNIDAKPRTKVIMGFKVALMLNFLTDDRHVVKALKENIPNLEGLNKVLIEEMNEYKKEMNK